MSSALPLSQLPNNCFSSILRTKLSSQALIEAIESIEIAVGWICMRHLVGFQHQEDSDMLDVSTSPFGSRANVSTVGWLFPAFGFIFFLGFFYAALLSKSKLLPSSPNQIISAIQDDRYYCFLVPITLLVLVIAIYFHWLSMKLFKHA